MKEREENKFEIDFQCGGNRIRLIGTFEYDMEKRRWTAIANKRFYGYGDDSTAAVIDMLKKFDAA